MTGEARVYEQRMRAGLGDAGPTGRVRLDALARWLQDVAWADVDDVGLADRAAWVLRRMHLHVERFPRFGESVLLRTACTGLGRMWAERTTTVEDDGVGVEAVALWVALEPGSLRPLKLGPPFLDVYAPSAGGRQVRARLHHPPPPPEAPATPWNFRAADLDLMGHVNNAAYWQPLEEELLAGEDPPGLTAELEFRGGAEAGRAWIVTEGARRWICQPEGEAVASLLVDRPAGRGSVPTHG